MHKKLKRVCSLAVLLAMLTQIAACSNTGVSGTKETTAETNSATADNTESTEAAKEDTKLYPNLPADLKFGGEEVRIMQHPAGGGDWAEWLSRDLYAESITGEPINDAVFERNSYVEDKLDVKLNVSDVSDMAKSIQQQASAGTGDYHISTARIKSLTATVTGGYLRNLYDVPYMDLTQPWYDANCIADASFYDMLFYVTGSMIILDDDSTGAIVFNKQLINDFNLESPYKFVQEGTWTLDKFSEYAQTVANDLNGNGKVDLEGDRFGILWQRDAIISFLHAGGSRIVSKNSDGEPEFVLDNENTINLMDKLDSFIFEPRVAQNMHNYYNVYPDISATECNVFKNNNALFMWIRMRVAENLRDMEADFGIIPVPKFKEEQDIYYSTVNKHTCATICIPNDASLNMDLIGAVIELMSAEGHYGLRDAYYEKNLGAKIARDPESTEMLDIIMSYRVYDTGEIYNIGGLADKLYSLSMGSKIGIATLLAKNQKVMNVTLEKSFVKPMKELAEKLK